MKNCFITLLVLTGMIVSSFAVFAKGGGINSGKPVPYIGDNKKSAEFLSKKIAKQFGGLDTDWINTARSLAKTLGQLDAGEQHEIWYGS